MDGDFFNFSYANYLLFRAGKKIENIIFSKFK